MNINQQAFIALVRAGLWEKDIQVSSYGEINYHVIYQLATQQTVVGIVAAGIEHVVDIKVPQDVALSFAGTTLQLEQRNVTMNSFLEKFFNQIQAQKINPLLVKGQGIAQCYERPLWRECGDVDLFLNAENYGRAKRWLSSIGKQTQDDEVEYKKHIAFWVDSWDVELHGTLREELSTKMDRVIDEIQINTFEKGNFRVWKNGETDVLIPAPDDDVLYVFAHVIKHFFRGGIGLRQICDWCRLLWTFHEIIDHRLLEKHLRDMGVMSEWHAFAEFAVETLGMPVDAMPLYSPSKIHAWKSKRICNYILKVGNFGHNRDMSYKSQSTFIKRMMISLKYRTSDFAKQVMIFPLDAVRAYWYIWGTGFKVVAKQMFRLLK